MDELTPICQMKDLLLGGSTTCKRESLDPAHQAARAFSSVTIKSPDTDVMVLSLAKSQDFHSFLLLFMTGSGSNNKIINITELGIKLGQEKC